MNTIDNVSLRTLTLFRTVAEHGGFAEAGRQLGAPRAVVSQLIAQLEAQLDTKLFKRTTRKVALTEVGEALLARIAQPLASLQNSLHSTRAQSDDVAGTVRLSASHALGRYAVLPALQVFSDQHPDVQIEITLADRIDDLIMQKLDFTIRMGELPSSSMVARKIATLDVCLVTTPQLLRAYGTPRSPAQLAKLPAIGFRVGSNASVYTWQLQQRGASNERNTVLSERIPAICNSIEGVLDLVRQGLGVAAIPRYLVESDISAGRLMVVLPNHSLPTIPVHLFFTTRALMPKRVRLVADHLAQSLKTQLAA